MRCSAGATTANTQGPHCCPMLQVMAAICTAEFAADPISWWQPALWQSTVKRWLAIGSGSARCVDQLIGFLQPLTLNEQVRIGLSWVRDLVLAEPDKIANRFIPVICLADRLT